MTNRRGMTVQELKSNALSKKAKQKSNISKQQPLAVTRKNRATQNQPAEKKTTTSRNMESTASVSLPLTGESNSMIVFTNFT